MRRTLAVIVGGASAGALDISYAILALGAKGTPPMRVLQSIASGLLGRTAYSGGASTALAGLSLHFVMTTMMAAGFVFAAGLFPGLLKRPLLSSIAYGLLLFALMNYLVMPLSAIHRFGNPQGWLLAGALLAHVFLVALPIVLLSRAFLARASADAV